MTVTELLAAILKACPGASPEALATYRATFFTRFSRREGPHLQAAFEETLARFKATARQPFPIPLDIEQHLPSLPKADAGTSGPPIRDMLERRAKRSRVLLNDWLAGQGAKIKAGYAQPLYAACLLEAQTQAVAKALDDRVRGIILDEPEFDECFQRAISSARLGRLGKAPHDPRAWWAQVESIAAEWGLTITPDWWSKTTADALGAKEAA